LLKLEEQTSQLNHLAMYKSSHEEVFQTFYNDLTEKIITYSMVLLAIMGLVGLFATFHLKNFLLNKKLI